MENKKLKLLKLKAKAAKAKLALMKIGDTAPDSKVLEWLQVAADHIKELAATEKYKGLTSTTDGKTMQILSAGKVIGTIETYTNQWGTISFHFDGENSNDCYINTYSDKDFRGAIIYTTDLIVEHALYPDTNDRSQEFAELAVKIVSRLAQTDEYKDKKLKVSVFDRDYAGHSSKQIEIRGKVKGGNKLIGVINIYHSPKSMHRDDYSLMVDVKIGWHGWGTGFNSKKDDIEAKLTHHISNILKEIYGNN
jgi:hypothetical protein